MPKHRTTQPDLVAALMLADVLEAAPALKPC